MLPADLQGLLELFKCKHTTPEGSNQAVLTSIMQQLLIFNNKLPIKLHFNLAV